jgi:phage terminase large subunit-like protein
VNNFLTKHLNVWVNAESSWMPMDAWRACGDPTLTPESLKDVPCWIGVDLAETRDIAAVMQVFKTEPDAYTIFGRYYLPREAVDKSPVAQYSGWERDGWLTVTEGTVADYQRIQADIVQLCHDYQVQEIDFDRALAQQMTQQLQAKLDGRPDVVVVPQGVIAFNPMMQLVERLVLSKQLRHAGDPVLTWMASNVVVQRNYKDEIYPRKAGGKDSHHKIDGIVAMLTALVRASVAESLESIYATRGLRMLGDVDATPTTEEKPDAD